MSKPAARLGRGLASLVGSSARSTQVQTVPHHTHGNGSLSLAPALQPVVEEDLSQPQAGRVLHLPLEQISPNPNQPRRSFPEVELRELAESIRIKGVLQPILVRSADRGKYELIAGERRWRAAKIAGLLSIPALLLQITPQDSSEIALIENLQRADLSPLERAAAYQSYLEAFGLRPEELAQRLGESRANVVNYMRLLKLPPTVQEALRAGALAMGQARALAGIADPQRQLAIANLAIRRNLSVRQVEELARSADEGQRTAAAAAPARVDVHLRDMERTLSKSIGLSARIQSGKRKNAGKVVIAFRTIEEFDMLLARLGVRPDA